MQSMHHIISGEIRNKKQHAFIGKLGIFLYPFFLGQGQNFFLLWNEHIQQSVLVKYAITDPKNKYCLNTQFHDFKCCDKMSLLFWFFFFHMKILPWLKTWLFLTLQTCPDILMKRLSLLLFAAQLFRLSTYTTLFWFSLPLLLITFLHKAIFSILHLLLIWPRDFI